MHSAVFLSVVYATEQERKWRLRPHPKGGDIALVGVTAETGVVMLIYLDYALTELLAERSVPGRPFTRDDLYATIMTGAVDRVRPKMMRVADSDRIDLP